MIAPRPASPWALPVHPTTGLTRPQLLGTLPDGSGSYARRSRASSGRRQGGGEMRWSRTTGGRSSCARVAVALAASALALFAIPSVPARAVVGGPRAEVRVNQVGYDLHGPKRAYLMSPVSEAGATFAVIRAGGRVVYSAP